MPTSSTTTLVARKGDAAPGVTNGKFSAFLSEAVNGSQVVFRASMTGGPSGMTSGIWRFAGSVLSPVALATQQAPGTEVGVKFAGLMNLFTADNGVIMFQAKLSGKGVNSGNDLGIWAYFNGALHLILREGNEISGSGGARLTTLQRFDLGKTGHYAALVGVKGSAGTNQALLLGSVIAPTAAQWNPRMVLRKGEAVDRLQPALIKSLGMGKNHLDATGSGSKGLAKLVNNHGALFTAIFASHTELLMGTP